MNKVKLAEKLADKMGFKKRNSLEIVETILDIMKETLAKGEKVQLIPFGILEIRKRRGRIGRNPRTGEKVQIKERRVAAFRAGKRLKAALAGKE